MENFFVLIKSLVKSPKRLFSPSLREKQPFHSNKFYFFSGNANLVTIRAAVVTFGHRFCSPVTIIVALSNTHNSATDIVAK